MVTRAERLELAKRDALLRRQAAPPFVKADLDTFRLWEAAYGWLQAADQVDSAAQMAGVLAAVVERMSVDFTPFHAANALREMADVLDPSE